MHVGIVLISCRRTNHSSHGKRCPAAVDKKRLVELECLLEYSLQVWKKEQGFCAASGILMK